MKKLRLSLVAGLMAILMGSCTNYYEQYPEGYVSTRAPSGYALVTIAGISYWHYHNHYYRHWPGYGYVVVRPPHNRPPYHRPPVKPKPPIHRPPGTKPPGTKPPGSRPPGSRPPSGKPVQLPSTRPSVPSTRPSMPSTRPSMPSTRPSMPSARPSMPTARPRMRR